MNLKSSQAVRFLSRRIALGKNMPRSVRIMRVITIIGISIAVMALVIASSVGKGFEREYVKALLDFNAHLIIARSDSLPMTETSSEEIRSALGTSLEGMTPFFYREALAVGGGSVKGVVVKGVDPRTVQSVNRMRILIDDQHSGFAEDKDKLLVDALGSKEKTGVILGKVLFERMQKPKSIRLMIPSDRGESFIELGVAGSFESGIYDFDSQFILVDIARAQKIYKTATDEVSGIEIRLKDPFSASVDADKVREMMGPAFEVTTWDQLNGDLISAVKLERFISAIIMSLLVIVAMMNVVAVMIVGLVYRLPDFSILRAIGLSDERSASVFMSQGLLAGTIGTTTGIFMGLFVCFVISHFRLISIDPEIYLISSLPIDISPLICGIVAVFSIICTFLASRLASHALSKVPIAEGLLRTR